MGRVRWRERITVIECITLIQQVKTSQETNIDKIILEALIANQTWLQNIRIEVHNIHYPLKGHLFTQRLHFWFSA